MNTSRATSIADSSAPHQHRGQFDVLRPGRALGDAPQIRVAGEWHQDLVQKPVDLGLGQGVGPLHLERVLRGQHEEGPGQRVASAARGDGVLLHRFEERALGPGRGAIDLVGKQHVREDRPWREAERAGLPVEDVRARDVAGHEVRRELDPPKGEAGDATERPHQQGLAEARHALEQDVAAGDERREHLRDDVVLTDDDLLESAVHSVELVAHVGPAGLKRRAVRGQGGVGAHPGDLTVKETSVLIRGTSRPEKRRCSFG
jgi:hypothetical protein